jgi:beta-galactosidase
MTRAGLIGDVLLKSSPSGGRVEDVFVQPSVRKHQLGLTVEVAGAVAGLVQWTAKVLDEKGQEEKRFTASTTLTAGDSTVTLAFPWANPQLWDVGQPYLYTLHLEAAGVGLADDYAQRFGFREFWIDGRKYFLNGTEFRARPGLATNAGRYGREAVERDLRELADFGFNLAEDWPMDPGQRGSLEYREALSDGADRIGLPITGIVNDMTPYLDGKVTTRNRYEARMAADLKRYRNHASIVMWGTTANAFGWFDDQNPRYLGRTVIPANAAGQVRGDLARALITVVKKHDPTRPVFTHAGGHVGDVYNTNTYLNIIPLQERAEWLSDWATNGETPFWAVEFGTPLGTTFLRGRHDDGQAEGTEPFVSEYCAIYFGKDAYKNEMDEYRQQIRTKFKTGQQYASWHSASILSNTSDFQQLQAIFDTQTYRAWRTSGLSGGALPWAAGYRFGGGTRETLNVGPFVPGRRGTYQATVDVVKPELSPAGVALKAALSPSLVYIGGSPAFTDQAHNFRAGTLLNKQVVLLNDTRAPQTYSYRWSISVNGKALRASAGKGTLAIAETRFAPIQVMLPKQLAMEKCDGIVTLTCKIGDSTQTDSFAFRVFASRPVTAMGPIAVFDPLGDTSRLLARLGYKPYPWKGDATPLVVVGRKALSSGALIPAELTTYVGHGGRALVMGQSPDYLRDALGFRTTYHPTRRVYRIGGGNPIVAGLDDTDLRDWTGSGTLVEAYPVTYKRSQNGSPYAGWHWGNRGSVASVAVEKPHLTGWRPLLECEFDLAYSPLMELDYGRGRITLCTLDLEDQAAVDPVAERLGKQLLRYVATAPIAPRAEAVYVGGPNGQKTLDTLGLLYKRVETIPATAGLVVVGEQPGIEAVQIEAFAKAGGKVLYLARIDSGSGVTITTSTDYRGALSVPNWPEAAGLSPSDLRWRVNGSTSLVSAGAEIGAEGQLGRRVVGKGVIVCCQLDPNQFDADSKTYYRLTRWRQTRGLAQVIANLGGSFTHDERALRPDTTVADRLSLASGIWKAIMTSPLSPSPSPDKGYEDPGISEAAKKLVLAKADEMIMQTVSVPGQWESYKGAQWQADGEGVLRKTFVLPLSLVGKELTLSLGLVDDNDATFFDGEQIGAMQGWNKLRSYTIPAEKATPGKHTIAVRVWDRFGGGGFTGLADDLYIKPAKTVAPASMYHPDYRTDFDLGDDPYRYVRW